MDQSEMSSTQEDTVTSHWAHLPSLVLTEVFSLLDEEDRRNASVVCKHWRENCFQRRWWNSMTFIIQPNEMKKVRFLTDAFGMTITYARIVLKSVSAECLTELIYLMRNLAANDNLKDLVVEYSPDGDELLHHFPLTEERSSDLDEITKLLKTCLPRLSGFTAACMAALSLCVGTILRNVDPSLLKRLEVTAMPSYSEKNYLDPALFKRLTKLQEFAIDQQAITDELLDVVQSWTELKKLVIYQRFYFRNSNPSGRAVNINHAIHRRKSRRFVQLFKEHRVRHITHTENSAQNIIIKHVLLF